MGYSRGCRVQTPSSLLYEQLFHHLLLLHIFKPASVLFAKHQDCQPQGCKRGGEFDDLPGCPSTPTPGYLLREASLFGVSVGCRGPLSRWITYKTD